MNWSQGTSNGTIYHKFARSQQVQYSESSDQADWGNWYWATGQTPGVRFLLTRLTTHPALKLTDRRRLRIKLDKIPLFAVTLSIAESFQTRLTKTSEVSTITGMCHQPALSDTTI